MFSSVLKANPYHDGAGRFTTKDKGLTRSEILKRPKATYSKLAESMDSKTEGHIDVQAVKAALKKGDNLYLEMSDWDLSKVDTTSIDSDVDPKRASPDKGSVILGKSGEIIDGRHRIAAAIAAGKKTISAWVPAREALDTATDKEVKKEDNILLKPAPIAGEINCTWFDQVSKYDKNQRRDKLGRWAISGGIGVASNLADARNDRSYDVQEVISRALGNDAQTKERYFAAIAEAEAEAAAGKTTKKIHAGKNGGYSPERRALHRGIINHHLKNADKARPQPGEQPTFIMLGGRGGSGKSNFDSSRNKEYGVYSSKSSVVIDPDAIKEMLPEYNPSKAHLTHEESSHIADRIRSTARKMGLNVVMDVTMRSDLSRTMDSFKKKGYRTEAHFMHRAPEYALEGAVRRWNAESVVKNPLNKTAKKFDKGRLVPYYIVEGNVNNEKNFDRIAAKTDHWSVVSNRAKEGFEGEKIAEKPKVKKSEATSFPSFAFILKANPYHDEGGKFTTKEKASYQAGLAKDFAGMADGLGSSPALDRAMLHLAQSQAHGGKLTGPKMLQDAGLSGLSIKDGPGNKAYWKAKALVKITETQAKVLELESAGLAGTPEHTAALKELKKPLGWAEAYGGNASEIDKAKQKAILKHQAEQEAKGVVPKPDLSALDAVEAPKGPPKFDASATGTEPAAMKENEKLGTEYYKNQAAKGKDHPDTVAAYAEWQKAKDVLQGTYGVPKSKIGDISAQIKQKVAQQEQAATSKLKSVAADYYSKSSDGSDDALSKAKSEYADILGTKTIKDILGVAKVHADKVGWHEANLTEIHAKHKKMKIFDESDFPSRDSMSYEERESWSNHQLKAVEALTKGEISSLREYTGKAFTPINREVGTQGSNKMLGKPVEVSDYNRKYMKDFDKAFNKVTLGKDMLLRRNMKVDWLEQQLGIDLDQVEPYEMVGKAYKEHAYSSSSYRVSSTLAVQNNTKPPVALMIRAPKETKAVLVKSFSKSPGEDEVLIGRGATYIIRKYDKKERKLYVDLIEQVPEDI